MPRLRSILTAALIFLALPLAGKAATLYFQPSDGTYGPGDSFALDIRLDIDEECVNTVEAEIDFPGNLLVLQEFLTGESILSVWVDRPSTEDLDKTNESGKLHFSGGIPGGYCGKIPGDPGVSNTVARLVFKIPGLLVAEEIPDTIKIGFGDNTRLFVNDGFGTEDNLKKKEAVISFSEKPLDRSAGLADMLREDNIPPEPFVIELYSNPEMFNGGYYALFSTVDKQSGIDHYEILEIKPGQQVGVKPESDWIDEFLGKEEPAPEWKRAKMPYLLADQTLSSIIKVKAVDKAGNERLVEYIPETTAEPAVQERSFWTSKSILYSGVLLLLAIAVILFLIILRIKKRRSAGKEEQNEDR